MFSFNIYFKIYILLINIDLHIIAILYYLNLDYLYQRSRNLIYEFSLIVNIRRYPVFTMICVNIKEDDSYYRYANCTQFYCNYMVHN